MGADFTRVNQELAFVLRQHADAEYDGKPLGGSRKAVFLARGGHAPGDECALYRAKPYAGWCAGCLAYDEDNDEECGCTCHRFPAPKSPVVTEPLESS